ncbi:FtsW/RodA/SpoVE family cell cycle protein [Actinorugispora endophytica]|uniref:Cell elongation-specific peptidoglycan biosynthesis regulator RodA n=1 Tax=Actinorugispora endophytica TaxID=1605990 RepID=A0A4R6V3J9_9ACTN|nr:FtsW/RodA/SpoVE family cell cycle protein [Actinorugispora endophytica]TDQ54851.1 cell elongation-specific peptidoglycan biosynthesis regulator RodA [Actinorugispora endophytica]
MTDETTPPSQRRRNTELAMLSVALLVFVTGFCFAGLSLDGRVPDTLWMFAAVLGAGSLAVHVGLRFLAPHADPLMLPLAVLLNGIGLVLIWGLHAEAGRPDSGAFRQLMWTGLGLMMCLAVLFAVRRPQHLQRYPYLMALAGLVLIASPMLPVIGLDQYGARRWLSFGRYTVQPSEFAKVPLVIFLAAYLGMKRDMLALAATQITVRGVKVFSVPRVRDMGPMTVAWGIAILLLVGTKDLGTSLLLFGLFLAMFYTATQRKSWVGIGLAMFLAGAYAAYLVFWHVQQRVTIWLHAFDPEVYYGPNGSYQVVEGLFALADGRLTGIGFGTGRAAGIFASDSDLILVSLGEKFGLAGLCAVMLATLLLVERAFRVALDARELFVKLMTTGLAFLWAFQVFVVLGGVTLLIPLSGMTTPLLSTGGSSLITSWIVVGLWLRVGDEAHRPAAPRVHDGGATVELPLGASRGGGLNSSTSATGPV